MRGYRSSSAAGAGGVLGKPAPADEARVQLSAAPPARRRRRSRKAPHTKRPVSSQGESVTKIRQKGLNIGGNLLGLLARCLPQLLRMRSDEMRGIRLQRVQLVQNIKDLPEYLTLDRRQKAAQFGRIAYEALGDVINTLKAETANISVDGHLGSNGATVFANNCASCHGPDGSGNPQAGVPNLTDPYWIYGGDEETIFTSVWGGRQGHMPTWEGRLSELDRKILTLYLLDKRGATP